STSFGVGSISVAAAGGWLEFRQPGVNWRGGCPRLGAWYLDACQRDSMLASLRSV
ncbi:glutathione S-transferase C-terminal domain-containing protein, partial [Pseudomonas syringae group genomosp. 7]|uniref:glutathione S-transferase C-terminal domain-containing protein n=1 Tax=Pseudomonas syringae group genomosp. 7 TaxID=251699 RepID=UPI00376F4CF9